MQEQKKWGPEYDMVATALLTCLSNGQNEPQKDNSLSIFLTKVYKNNTAPKPKRMNSIRLSRFNAFLYRVNLPFPDNLLTNKIIHLSLIAMLNNSRNFEEEEDQQIIMSIARWCCNLIQKTAMLGFQGCYQIAFDTLSYLLGELQTESFLISLDDFEALLKNCTFLSNIELSAQDEKNAYSEAPFRPMRQEKEGSDSQKNQKFLFWEQSNFHITIPFPFNLFILRNIRINEIYSSLFKGLDSHQKKRSLLKLFAKHIAAIVPLSQPKIDLFLRTFINDQNLISANLGVLLQVLDQENFGYENILVARDQIFALGFNLSDVFSMQLKGTDTEQLFLQSLFQKFKNNGLNEIVRTFLACQSANLIGPSLIASSEETIPHQYLDILFGQEELTQRHSIVLAFLVAQNMGSNNFHEKIIKGWENYHKSGTVISLIRSCHFVKIIYMCLSDCDKNLCYSRIYGTLDLNTINKAGQLGTYTLGHLNSSKLTPGFQTILSGILMNTPKLGEDCLPLQTELLGICGENFPMTRKIKDLNALFQLPIQQIFRRLINVQLAHDPTLFAAALMGLNNKIDVTFIEDPEEITLKFLSQQYIRYESSFCKKLGALVKQKQHSPLGNYLAALAKYNMQSDIGLGNFSEPLASLLSAKQKYNRVEDVDFSGYFYREEISFNYVDQTLQQKKVFVELRALLKKLFRKEKTSSDIVKEVKGQLDAQWAFPLGFKLIQTYFQAGMYVNDPQVLRYVLSKTPPEFSFFDRVCSIFHSQGQDYIDFLTFLPQLLKSIYPETIAFFAKLLDSQGVIRKQKEKRKAKKKKAPEKIQMHVIEQVPPILDLPTLFQFFKKEKALPSLFGDPSQLESFDQLFKIISKLPVEDIGNLGQLIQNWLQTFSIFHPQSDSLKWRTKVLSYCRIWRVMFIQLKLQLTVQILSKHLDILTELLNMHYESKSQFPELEEQLLVTLLLVMQASQPSPSLESKPLHMQSFRNSLIGFKLPIPCDQHFFTCYTCNLTVCQVCAPFLHKHHDLCYMGKDGTCVHDSSMKKLPPPSERNPGAAPGRPPRRQEDLFPLNFDLGDEEMDFNEHIRFRQLMEYRLREQQRDRDRQYQMMKERMDRQRAREQREVFVRQGRHRPKDDIVEESNKNVVVEQQVNEEVISDIKSDSSKSIRNLEKGNKSSFKLVPEFNPVEQFQAPYLSKIDAKPLARILIRQMEIALNEEHQQGISKAEVSKDKYNFFKQSAYFKSTRGDYGGIMRGGFGVSNMPVKRNLLTSNRKFLAFPSSSNGILLLSLAVIGMKLQRRQNTKAMAEYEQERTYITNAINNSNLSFEPFQLSFSKSSQNLLAVVGVSQLGFFVLANQGKVQRFMESDIKCPEPISKFEWIGRHRTSVFALAFGSNIRIGSITEDFKVKAGSKLKIQIDKVVRDFQISVETNILSIYVIDQEGAFYKADFDHRDTCTFSIQDKKVQLPNLGQLTSLILVGKKLIVSNNSAKLHLIKTQSKGSPLSIIQSYDIEQALKNCSQSKIKGTFYMSHPKLIHNNENVISIGCILRRSGSEGKKRGGALAILRISGSNNDLDIIVLSEDQSVQFFEVIELAENNYSLVAVEESGNVWMSPYSVSAQLLYQKEQTRITITQESVIACNKVMKARKLINMVKFCDPRHCNTFKDYKEITSAYSIIVDHPTKITFRTNNPHKYFIAGISIKVQGVGEFSVVSWNEEQRRSIVEKQREIQIGFTLEETLVYFIEDEEFSLPYQTKLSCISGKAIRIYGIQFSQQSIYRKAYAQLHRLVTLSFWYDEKNLVHYLQNYQKKDLPSTNLLQFQKLKTTYRYSPKEFILLMKLQLLRVSTNDSLRKEEIADMIGFVRNNLFSKCQKRIFLEKSCLKLLRQLCNLYQQENSTSLGRPYQIKTMTDFYNFQRYFDAWNNSRQLSSFENLLSFLYSLIFKRITNLYLLMQLHPNLIYELTFFYKNALHSLKHSSEHADQAQLAKLINICPSYVAIICQYYQTLKNSPVKKHQMIEETNQYSKSAEKIVLDLLEEVFCATKKELYRQIFVCPQLYLERMYLTEKKPITLSTGIDIFRVQPMQGEHCDHASRKASILPQQPNQSEEQEIQLEQESNRQMLEQQDREMPSQQSVHESSQIVSSEIDKIVPKAIHKLSTYLNGYTLSTKRLQFTYYQFNFEIATALFKIPDYMVKQNAVFYMGFLFNLLRILEFNAHPTRDYIYLTNLFRAVLDGLSNAKYSLLYLVLNYFFQPVYGEKNANGVRQIKKCKSKLAKYFCYFVTNQGVVIQNLMKKFKVEKASRMVTMTQVMKFVNFQLENHLYALRFLGNIYLLVRAQELPQLWKPEQSLKQMILRTVVKHNMRIFKNIMLMQGWAGQLQQAKVEVGFETLRQKSAEGVKLLYECATKNKEVFVSMLSKRNELIGQLESILGDHQVKDNMVLQMLNIYYESA